MNDWQPIEYAYNRGNIVLPAEAPFDGKPVLVRTNTGVVEAWWQDWNPSPTLEDSNDGDGWQWVCYDDEFTCDLDDVKEWMPIP